MNLATLLDMAVTNEGDRPADAHALRAAARHGAALIMQNGASALLHIAVTGPAFPVGLFASAVAGVPFVPIDPRLDESQLTALLANHPRAFAIVDEQHMPVVEPAAVRLMAPEAWLAETTSGTMPGRPVYEPAPDSTAVIIYTGGEGVPLRHDDLVSHVLGGAGSDEATYHEAAVTAVLSNLYAGSVVD